MTDLTMTSQNPFHRELAAEARLKWTEEEVFLQRCSWMVLSKSFPLQGIREVR